MKGVVEQRLSADALLAACVQIQQDGGRMQMAYAWYPERETRLEVAYLIAMGAAKPLHLWRIWVPADKVLPSLTNIAPLMGWYEREIHDLYGIDFLGHPELYPLVLHQGVSLTSQPMHKDYPSGTRVGFQREAWQLPDMDLAGVQLLPYGPVHGGVSESVEFLYVYAGESILHCYERLFFKHRGMEKRFEGLRPELAVLLAERVSGVSSVAHSLAFCQAVETAADLVVPERARQWRVILAECERLYNHLHYLACLSHTTTLKVAEAEGKILEERLKQLNARVTGSRLLRGILTPGGLRREPTLEPLMNELSGLQNLVSRYGDALLSTNSYIDRLIGTGKLVRQIAFDEGATGPVARASGVDSDFRINHPYAAYGDLSLKPALEDAGDALARMKVRLFEINQSFQLIRQVIDRLRPGPIYAELPSLADREGLAGVESARGCLYYAVHFDEHGCLVRVKIKSPSFSNWRVFPFTVDETNLMDFAINEASFGSTVAGCDR